MPKQKIEIEIDVPDGMEIKCQGTRNDLRPVITPTECTNQIVCNVILRRKEPVRESRWRFVPTLHGSPCYTYLYPTLDDARKALGCNPNGVYTHIERLDYEDNKVVAVTLEPLGEEVRSE
jgi:hypothetical protein